MLVNGAGPLFADVVLVPQGGKASAHLRLAKVCMCWILTTNSNLNSI